MTPTQLTPSPSIQPCSGENDPQPILQIQGVIKGFPGQSTPALNDITFDLYPVEIIGLLGPSGCGKTTLLRIIAGFESPSQGSVTLGGNCVSSRQALLPPEKRNTGMVFQDYALFPHLTIADNIAFGLKQQPSGKQLNRGQIRERIAEVLDLVGLSGLEKRYPHELSGGQQQRIALARALAPRPRLILLDEPLSNLDVQVRRRLRHEIRRILKATGIAVIFVTHDQEEAMAISDRIGVMHQGNLAQIDHPEVIYTQPANRFVAEFVTQANFLTAYCQGDEIATAFGHWQVLAPIAEGPGEIMLREEEIEITPATESTVKVCDRQFLGREYRYCLQSDSSGQQLHARLPLQTQIPIGAAVSVSLVNQSPKIFPNPA